MWQLGLISSQTTRLELLRWVVISNTYYCESVKACVFLRLFLVIEYFCIHCFKYEWPNSSHSIKQTTIGLIGGKCHYQGLICLELLRTDIFKRGTFFLFGVYITPIPCSYPFSTILYSQALSNMEEFRNLDRDIEGSAKRWKKFVESRDLARGGSRGSRGSPPLEIFIANIYWLQN
jgi:hypothetical protein